MAQADKISPTIPNSYIDRHFMTCTYNITYNILGQSNNSHGREEKEEKGKKKKGKKTPDF